RRRRDRAERIARAARAGRARRRDAHGDAGHRQRGGTVRMKRRVAIIGSGNIGTDLLYKVRRSASLEAAWMVGIDEASDGLARARSLGVKTTAAGVEGLLPHLKDDAIAIVFDATSAYAHQQNWRRLAEHDVRVVDLTPAAIGPYCIPPVN